MLKNTCEHRSHEQTWVLFISLGRRINGNNYLLQWSGILFFLGKFMDLLVRIQVHARNQEGPMQGTFGSNKPAKHKQRID
jgi:hypothetical protein